MKGKNLKTRFSSGKNLIENWCINQKLYKQAKVKTVQQHQTSIAINDKVTSLGRKNKRNTKTHRNKPKTCEEMVMWINMSITLNLNELNTLT